MVHIIETYLPWAMSAITIVAIELQGRKWPRAWALSLAGQLLWIVWVLFTWDKNLGFAPMIAILTVQYARNHLKWKREAQPRAWVRWQHWNCRCAAPPEEACAQEGAWNAQKPLQDRRSPEDWGMEGAATARARQEGAFPMPPHGW